MLTINPENSVDLMDNDKTNSLFADGEHIFYVQG